MLLPPKTSRWLFWSCFKEFLILRASPRFRGSVQRPIPNLTKVNFFRILEEPNFLYSNFQIFEKTLMRWFCGLPEILSKNFEKNQRNFAIRLNLNNENCCNRAKLKNEKFFKFLPVLGKNGKLYITWSSEGLSRRLGIFTNLLYVNSISWFSEKHSPFHCWVHWWWTANKNHIVLGLKFNDSIRNGLDIGLKGIARGKGEIPPKPKKLL